MSFMMYRHVFLSSSSLRSTPLTVLRASIRTNTTAAGNGSGELTMSWPRYFRARRSKRRWELLASIPSAGISLALGVYYLGNLETDPTKPIFGIDPIFVLGAATLGIGGLGYLLGPVIGSVGWRMTHRQILPLLEAREREFYKHIARNRVDPRAQSPTNPIPDFYGEKVGSLHQYRQWLRDQSKYRKKTLWVSS